MKLENVQALTAIVLSILAHAAVAVLGDYQSGKSGNKVGSLSVRVASHSNNNTTQQSSELLTDQAPELMSETTAEPAATASKDQIVDEIVVPVTAEASAVKEKATETFVTKPTAKITPKHIATPDPVVRTDSTESTTPVSKYVGQAALYNAAANNPELPQSASSPQDAPSADIASDNTPDQGGESANEGLVTASIPVISAIPLYHLIPKPHYPERSRDLGEEGTVIIAIKVAENGSVAKAYVSKTSGHMLLDGSALSSVRSQWRFRPATQAGKPVVSWVRVPITFNIKSH